MAKPRKDYDFWVVMDTWREMEAQTSVLLKQTEQTLSQLKKFLDSSKFEKETKLIANRPNSLSVLTTVPKVVCDELGLHKGDTVVWKLMLVHGAGVAVVYTQEGFQEIRKKRYKF